jgi:hypothetical protein
MRVSVLFVVPMLVGLLTHATPWSIGDIHLNIIGVSTGYSGPLEQSESASIEEVTKTSKL